MTPSHKAKDETPYSKGCGMKNNCGSPTCRRNDLCDWCFVKEEAFILGRKEAEQKISDLENGVKIMEQILKERDIQISQLQKENKELQDKNKELSKYTSNRVEQAKRQERNSMIAYLKREIENDDERDAKVTYLGWRKKRLSRLVVCLEKYQDLTYFKGIARNKLNEVDEK